MGVLEVGRQGVAVLEVGEAGVWRLGGRYSRHMLEVFKVSKEGVARE